MTKTSATQVDTQTEEKSTSAFNPVEVEARWSKAWFDNGLFDTKIKSGAPAFSMALPPPNITGNLHMGHALNGTLQDILIRYKRMSGYNVLWQPGTDHAGISTQMVVERQLKKQNINRHQLGREGFLKHVWQWRKEYGNTIVEQYRRLGVSFSWDRLAFTMDPNYERAIYRAFAILFREGYIYRGNRVTNWCPRCLTSLSDLEVEHEETKGHLYHIKYPLVDGSGALTVATTRPESMFGDVAVAVNPKDKRYKAYIGKEVVLPLTERKIPVIGDDYVDMEFGTGALKITPAHDANDFEVGQRHKLEQPVVIDRQGKLCANEFVPAQFAGKDRFEVRKDAVKELEEKGFLEEIKDYEHGVGHCERCHVVIEPMLSEQWYVRMKELAAPAIDVVENGSVEFIPSRYAATYLDWMRNIRDWCISRQLWWGHRIPVWTCQDCNHVFALEPEYKQIEASLQAVWPDSKCPKCSSASTSQDEDVLDTWFSSALWPFATLGWPDKTEEFAVFYPTSALSTAREIINLWVARMIFTSVKFVGTIPFKQVLIHPVVQTADGKRMSKSKGNAVDPLDMIEKYGADANRFWFASLGIKGDQDVRFREDKLDEYKRFANKLWNAGRFVLTQLEGYKFAEIDLSKLSLADRWILNQYSKLLSEVSAGLDNYDFQEVSRKLYEFTWDEFCDWYLEIAKVQIQSAKEGDQSKAILFTIFEGLLRSLHPIMPFITDELWTKFQEFDSSNRSNKLQSIMFASFPQSDKKYLDPSSEDKMSFLIKLIRSIRSIRQTYSVPAAAMIKAIAGSANPTEQDCLELGQDYICRLARLSELELLRLKDGEKAKSPQRAAVETISDTIVFVPLSSQIDIEKTRERILSRKQSIEKECEKVRSVLEKPGFKEKAPKDKVENLEGQLKELSAQVESISKQMAVLEN